MYIEPFNCTMRVVCFDFGTGNMDSSVIKTGRKPGEVFLHTRIEWLLYRFPKKFY